jgi:5-methyltetrahydropteroyltriglutamate--homocysteine methyltransferase
MKSSTDRIITTHAGSLPRPPELLTLVRAKISGQPYDERELAAEVTRSVEAVTKAQADVGLDVVSDGEMSKPSFLGYITERLGGVRVTTEPFGSGKGRAKTIPFRNIMLGKPRSISIRPSAPSASFATHR